MRLWAVAVFSAFLASCGSSGLPAGSGGPASPTTLDAQALGVSALETTIKAGTSRVTIDTSFGGAALIGFHAAGVFDYRVGTGTLHLTGKGLPSNGTELRFVKGVAYLEAPKPYSLLPGVKPWIRLDLHEAARAGYFGKLSSVGKQHPGQALDFLRGAKSVERIGPETIGSDPTTRYKIVVDLRKARDASPATSPLRSLAESALHDLTIDLWVDGMGRCRKVTYTWDVGAAEAMTVSVEYFDFGVPVDVVAPPAGDVGEYVSILGSV